MDERDNQEKLAKLQAQVCFGEKESPCSSMFVPVTVLGQCSQKEEGTQIHKTASADDKKLQFSLKKLGVNNISGIEEVNMFTDQGMVIHVNNPKVQASLAANTFTIMGRHGEQAADKMLPGILTQLGADSLTSLRRLAESLPKQARENISTVEEEDDDVPDLVEDFDEASNKDSLKDMGC